MPNTEKKYLFITGGVVSSLGKGLTAGVLGALLENRKIKVCIQKFDPYLNVDPGTMNPLQHGEVYVLDDGTETDLDLGHYERFTHSTLSKINNLTSGQIYESVIQKERRGDYLGKTVQVIPHVTHEIKTRIREASHGVEVLITEIGGTTGDIEGLPFLEAMRQFALEVGKENVLFIHLTLIPYLSASGELKTKPSQQSVAKLREIGIQPDILICRTEKSLPLSLREKLSLFCNVPIEAVIEEKDVDFSIYELPLMLNKEHLDQLVIDKLQLNAPPQSMKPWEEVVRRLQSPAHRVNIGVVGKYIELQDAYKSIYEALTHGGVNNDCGVNIIRIDSETLKEEETTKTFQNLDGILVPGGFGDRGIEGKVMAAHYARTMKIPFLGICLGMQVLVIEFARNVLGLKNAHSTEFDPETTEAVIDLLEEQKTIINKGATMRLGAYSCKLLPHSLSWKAYEHRDQIKERHRHRYEFNNAYREKLTQHGLRIAGINPERDLVEIVEVIEHPWMIGVQFHPEFQSKPNEPHPLFSAFIAATSQ